MNDDDLHVVTEEILTHGKVNHKHNSNTIKTDGDSDAIKTNGKVKGSIAYGKKQVSFESEENLRNKNDRGHELHM